MYLLLDLYLLWFPSKHLIPLGHSQPSWICVQVSACIGIGRIGIGGGTIWDRIAVTTGGRFSTQCLRAVAFSLSAIISKVIDKISSWNFFWSASSSIEEEMSSNRVKTQNPETWNKRITFCPGIIHPLWPSGLPHVTWIPQFPEWMLHVTSNGLSSPHL